MDLERYVNETMEEYCLQLPPGDQSILREYFVPVSEIKKRKKGTMHGLSKSDDELMEDSVRELCVGMSEKRIRRTFKIVNKAFEFIEQRSLDVMTGHKASDICVQGSNCHYKKEFLLMRISDVPESTREKFGKEEYTTNVHVQQTQYDPISASRITTAVDLEAFQQMKIIELKPGKIHNNKVIYATVIDNGFQMTAYHTIVEDNYNQCAKLCIYNITQILLSALKKGVKIAIVNPYYKRGDDAFYYIRQESPDDVILMLDEPVVDRTNENVNSQSSESHKAEGNNLFKHEKYENAIHSYTKAISLDKSNPALWSNRAQCYIKLKRFEIALTDAEQANQLDSSSAKFKYRMAMAWSGLGDHEQSCEILESIENLTPDLAVVLEKERILLGNTRGEFDFEEMARQAEKCEEIQIGEFVGPISIQSSSKHGHAVIATRDIKKGDLISVSKAIGFVSHSKDKDLKEIPLYETNPTGRMVDQATTLVIRSLTDSVTRSKLAAFRVFPLYNKRKHQEHIPIEYYTSKGYTYVRARESPPYQIQQLRDIVCQSKFSYTPYYEQGYVRPSGVWPIQSFFNHTCIGNFWPKCYRDVLIIRACTDIAEGAELTTSFIDTYDFLTVEKRRYKLDYIWEWHCDCALCEFESDPRNKNALTRAVLLYNRAPSVSGQGNMFKLLNQAFNLAEELKLGKHQYNSAVWKTINTLILSMDNKKEIRKYLGMIYRARTFLCELDLKHQWYYWMNCVMVAKSLQLNDEFRLEAEAKFKEVESFIIDVA